MVGNPNLTGVLGVNPMSPYETPSSTMVYANIVEYINNHPYHGWFPESYTPIPDYFTRFGLQPIYVPDAEMDYGKGVMTIGNMIEMTYLGLPWRLDEPRDLDDIIDIVEEYQDIIARPATLDGTMRDYYDRVTHFLAKTKKVQARNHRRANGGMVEKVVDFLSLILGRR